MRDIIHEYFEGGDEVVRHNLSFLVEGIMRSGTASPWHAARSMSAVNNQSFKTNEKRANRLLQDVDFQINDELFRKYVHLLFDVMTERKLLKTGDVLQINVDYTTDSDDFLILMASVKFEARAVPLYFSMRAYPKRKGQHNQKKLESSFIKALRHLLPKKYKYIIVADRGFGILRFEELCLKSGFDYVFRMNENLSIKIGDNPCNLNDFLGKDAQFTAFVSKWEKNIYFEIVTLNGSTWFLMMSDPEILGKTTYERRFSIEKCFQDQKSSGLNIEKCKIKKYDRFKRLYFVACLAQLLIVVIGEYIENKNHPLKKRFPILVDVISAFSSLVGMPVKNYFAKSLKF